MGFSVATLTRVTSSSTATAPIVEYMGFSVDCNACSASPSKYTLVLLVVIYAAVFVVRVVSCGECMGEWCVAVVVSCIDCIGETFARGVVVVSGVECISEEFCICKSVERMSEEFCICSCVICINEVLCIRKRAVRIYEVFYICKSVECMSEEFCICKCVYVLAKYHIYANVLYVFAMSSVYIKALNV